MDNSLFPSFFWGLSDENTNEKIVNSAESITSIIETKQKFENGEKEFDKKKYSLYLNLCENSTEDLLYTMKRIVGGISSTGLNYRRGFTLTFNLLIQKFSNVFNFQELINIIEKETFINKSEKGHIRNCAISGKILMLQSVLEISTLTSENIIRIFNIIFDLLPKNRIVEEAILKIISDFFDKLCSNFYFELQNSKKFSKFLDKFLNYFNKSLLSKSNLQGMKSLYEYSLIYILLCYISPNNSENSQELSKCVRHFFPNSVIDNILSEPSLLNYSKILCSTSLKDGEFHYSFICLLHFLKTKNDMGLVIHLWNFLIDNNSQNQLKQISLKNYQTLIYLTSKFILENFFILKYIKEIFDSSFFENLLKFTSNKKFKYISSLIELLMKQMKNYKEEKEVLSNYSYELLKIFGGDNISSLSPHSYKSFFTFLFNKLEENMKLQFIDSLTNENIPEEDDVEEQDDSFKINLLRQLMVTSEVELPKSLKSKILQYFFISYFNSQDHSDIEFEDLIEDRLLSVVFSFLRTDKYSDNEDSTHESIQHRPKQIKDKKVIHIFGKIHKILQQLINSKDIEEIEVDTFKIYQKYFKKFNKILLNVTQTQNGEEKINLESKEKEQLDKIYSILKIVFVVLILYLKNPNEYLDITTDLLQVVQFGENWESVYTDLIISLLHKGNNTLSDYVMNSFKKISKYLSLESIKVIVGFLSSTKNDEEMSDNDDNVNTNHPNHSNGMFQDLGNDMLDS